MRNAPPEDCVAPLASTTCLLADPDHPDSADACQWADDYDPEMIDELPIRYALARIANRRNAAKARLLKKA